MSILKNYQLSDLSAVSAQVIAKAKNQKIWTFNGEMGAGKTTLIKAVCATLGVLDEVSSPTFSMVNEYKTKNNSTVFHFDFYRIKSIEEAYDMGIEDYFESGNICLIEWPSMIEAILAQENTFNITIDFKNNERQITLS
ncbi:MAG: tRNA (adenosine(37)-N6)-threonylcarbamoyltransferase complex ATPase subunit type 1 TsaE [Bacteroidia bacterium]|nr:tRNA (adenosine(37)-N6)-threonylcarbamoyltransferase complex ATPase subunit type 1 TsaE [Bacteroidia bacterium]